MLHVQEVSDIHWRWRQLHAGGTSQSLLVSPHVSIFEIFLRPFAVLSGRSPRSGRCFSQAAAAAAIERPHTVALVTLPAQTDGHRGLKVATGLGQGSGPLVTVTACVKTLADILNVSPRLPIQSSLILFQVRLGHPCSRPAAFGPRWRQHPGSQRHSRPQRLPRRGS